jgi:CheY-like chemotaxis protein
MVAVVDDHEDVGKVVALLIRAGGHEAEYFDSCEGFLEALPKRMPSLVILDIMMPDMDGMECLRVLRADPRWKDIPVVMFSADDRADRVEQARRAGAQDFMLKSGLRCAQLLEMVDRYAMAGG